MENEKLHPVKIDSQNIKTNYQLGVQVAELRYDQLCEFLIGFADSTRKQADGDRVKGRIMLSDKLNESTDILEKVILKFSEIMELCDKHLTDEYNLHPKSFLADELIISKRK